jgi:transcription initiation factor TFIIH subunit 4
MVSSGSGQLPTKPSQGVLFLLQRSGLMANQYVRCLLWFDLCSRLTRLSYSGSVLQITSAGFQFLLHKPHDQLWDLLLQYLHLAEVHAVLRLAF